MEMLAVSATAALLGLLGIRLVRGLDSVASGIVAALAGAVGYLLADVATGTVHWFCDTFFEEDTPRIGPLLIAPFREHHRDPLAMTRHGFFELTGNSCLALLPVLALALWAGPGPAGAATVTRDSFCLALALSGAATNVFHRWAHDPAPPRAAVWLQRWGLILTPVRHAAHHAPPHAAAYCVTSGWMNMLLDRIDFFAHAERAFRVLGLPAARG